MGSSAISSDVAGGTLKRGPRRSWRGLVFVLPYLPFLIVFGIAPTIYALDLALTHANGSWAGYHNFEERSTTFASPMRSGTSSSTRRSGSSR